MTTFGMLAIVAAVCVGVLVVLALAFAVVGKAH